MSTLSGKRKILMLPSQGVSYAAKWGRWVDGFASCLAPKGLHVLAALDTAMPTEYPEVNEDLQCGRPERSGLFVSLTTTRTTRKAWSSSTCSLCNRKSSTSTSSPQSRLGPTGRISFASWLLDIACVWSLEAWWCRSQGLHRATPSLHGRALLRRARTTIEIDGTRSISC